MKNSEENGGGQSRNRAPIKIVSPEEKILSSVLCRASVCPDCADLWETFEYEDHPDNGREFLCGVLQENYLAGTAVLHCPYFRNKVLIQATARLKQAVSAMIDAEIANRDLQVKATLARRKVNDIIDADEAAAALARVNALRARIAHPKIVAEELAPGYKAPSPHPFIDKAMERVA